MPTVTKNRPSVGHDLVIFGPVRRFHQQPFHRKSCDTFKRGYCSFHRTVPTKAHRRCEGMGDGSACGAPGPSDDGILAGFLGGVTCTRSGRHEFGATKQLHLKSPDARLSVHPRERRGAQSQLRQPALERARHFPLPVPAGTAVAGAGACAAAAAARTFAGARS